MESSFASRVKQFRAEKQLSQAAFAERCGLTQGNVTHMEGGKEPLQSNVAKLVAGFPDLNPDWLLLGTGPMLRDGRALTPTKPTATTPETETPEPRAAAEPQPDYTSASATQQTLYIELLKEQVADLKADKVRNLAEIDRLLSVGKAGDSSDAADGSSEKPTPKPTGPTGQGLLPLPALRVQRVKGLRSYDTEE